MKRKTLPLPREEDIWSAWKAVNVGTGRPRGCRTYDADSRRSQHAHFSRRTDPPARTDTAKDAGGDVDAIARSSHTGFESVTPLFPFSPVFLSKATPVRLCSLPDEH